MFLCAFGLEKRMKYFCYRVLVIEFFEDGNSIVVMCVNYVNIDIIRRQDKAWHTFLSINQYQKV